jgi:hypothetical protein
MTLSLSLSLYIYIYICLCVCVCVCVCVCGWVYVECNLGLQENGFKMKKFFDKIQCKWNNNEINKYLYPNGLGVTRLR